MDVELREKIEQSVGQELSKLLESLGCAGGCFHQEVKTLDTISDIADSVLSLLPAAGYIRLPPGEPPVLGDAEIGDLLDLDTEYTYRCSDGSELTTVDGRPIAHAQVAADMRWLKGQG